VYENKTLFLHCNQPEMLLSKTVCGLLNVWKYGSLVTQAETYIVCLYDLIHVLFYSSETDIVFKKYRNLFLRNYKVKYRYLLSKHK